MLLHGPDLCSSILLGRPSLELLEQDFGWWLIFGLALMGSIKSGNNFVVRRRQSLSAGN
jgi:hypothetical protein